MFRVLIFYVAFASFGVASCISASQPNDSGSVIELPKLPAYPADGKIPPRLSNRFVFLDGQNSNKMIVTLPPKNFTRTIVGRMTLKIGVCPSLSIEIVRNGSEFEYEYALTNLPAAKQAMSRWVQPLPFKAPVKLLAVARSSGWMGSEANPDESSKARNIDYLRDVTRLVDTHRVTNVIQRKIDWFSVVNPGVASGETVQPYRMRTQALPGIVVVYFEGGAMTIKDMIWGDSSWPPDMLGQVLALDCTENDSVSVLTVAPKFDPGTDRATIANDYFSVIDGAIKQKRLRTSTFLKEAMLRLTAGRDGSSPWASTPVTPLEKQIFLGMELSLN